MEVLGPTICGVGRWRRGAGAAVEACVGGCYEGVGAGGL